MEKTRDYDRIAAFFFLAVGIFFTLYARSVEIGEWHAPGPGFLPFWGGLTLTAMSLALLLQTFGGKIWTAPPPFFPQRDSWRRVVSTFLALAAYNLLLSFLGFFLTTFFFLAFLMKFIFPQTWRRTVGVALLGSVIAHLIFVRFLETQLPKGIFGF